MSDHDKRVEEIRERHKIRGISNSERDADSYADGCSIRDLLTVIDGLRAELAQERRTRNAAEVDKDQAILYSRKASASSTRERKKGQK